MLRKAVIPFALAALCGLPQAPAAEISGKASNNLAKVVTATTIGGKGSEWFTSGGVLANGDILVTGISVDAELTLLGKKAKVYGTDQAAFKPIKGWPILAKESTGKVRWDPNSAIGETAGGGGDSDLDLDADDLLDGDDFLKGGGPKKTAAQKEEEAEQKAKALAKKLGSVPRGYKRKSEGEGGATLTHYTKLYPEQEEATGFIMIMSPDLKTVKFLQRLPRGAGSITSAAVAKDGSVFITGTATNRISSFHKPLRNEKHKRFAPVDRGTFGARQMYVAKLTPDCSKVEWLVTTKGWTIPPKMTLLNDGNVVIHGVGLRTYTPDGKLVQEIYPGRERVLSGLSVSPYNGEYAKVGDWMSPTGREPYRTPRCVIGNPDGSIKKALWLWRGPFAGVDALRLVADSAVRRSAYGNDGRLLVTTWSHGGNNVMFRYPYDVDRFMPNPLGYITSETCAVAILMDKDHNVINSMHWSGFMHDAESVVDGSWVVMPNGGSDSGMPNRVSKLRCGPLIKVITPDLDGLRFSSNIPATGQGAVVHGCRNKVDGWGFASGVSNGRTLLLGFSSSLPEQGYLEMVNGKGVRKTTKPALINPLQKGFGGGLIDGYLMVLDITADEPFKKREPKPRKKAGKPYQGPVAWPEEGQKFIIGGETYLNTKIVFRDGDEKMWPSYFGGNAVPGGVMAYSEGSDGRVDFTLEFPHRMLWEGDQQQKVLGEVFNDTTQKANNWGKNKPPVTLRVTGIVPWNRTDKTRRIAGVQCGVGTTTVSGHLTVAGKKLHFEDGSLSTAWKYKKGEDPSSGTVLPSHGMNVLKMKFKGSALGLSGDLAEKDVSVKIDFSCFYAEIPTSGW